MAVIWEREIDGSRLEVRSAGATRRLYRDGVMHTQFNPRTPLTGSVWDLLLLPAFLLPPGRPRRVLVLGVGGGAVIRQLLTYTAVETVVGVELDPMHLELGRRFFGLGDERIELHQADALRWLRGYRGPRFDLIIDDVFGENDGEPVRAIECDRSWARLLLRHLDREGAITANFPSRDELLACAFNDADLATGFSAGFQFTGVAIDNAVGAWTRQPATTRLLRARLGQQPALDPRKRSCRLRYRVRTLFA